MKNTYRLYFNQFYPESPERVWREYWCGALTSPAMFASNRQWGGKDDAVVFTNKREATAKARELTAKYIGRPVLVE